MTDTATAVADLRAIREQWGDLLAAIDQPPPQEWPPRETRSFLTKAAEPRTDTPPSPQVGRLPLTLREHPAPLNLGALDAAMEIEWALFDLADRIASVVQRSIRQVPVPNLGPRARWIADPADYSHPDRWNYVTPTSPGSRALGLHWACVWIEDRLAATASTELHQRVPELVAEEAAEEFVAAARRVMQRALGRDGRVTAAADPCPWCHGTLTMRTTSGDPDDATVTCDTGPSCTAPTPYDDRARRTWHGREQIGALVIAILHDHSRATA